jgi:hypothetical protein
VGSGEQDQSIGVSGTGLVDDDAIWGEEVNEPTRTILAEPVGTCAAVAPATGRKYDGGKAPIHQGVFQYFPRALLSVAEISKYGAEKYQLDYQDINWARVEGGRGRYGDARGRHILGEFIDGPIDPESGKLHAAMAAWNALAYLELILKEENGTK